MFGDAPHLIKLIRNNLLNHGFGTEESLGDGSGVRELVRKSVEDIKVTHRLYDKHNQAARSARMKVNFVVQLLTETTGKALRYFEKRGLIECKKRKATSEFILLVNSWFDLFNSRMFYGSKSSQNAYILMRNRLTP